MAPKKVLGEREPEQQKDQPTKSVAPMPSLIIKTAAHAAETTEANRERATNDEPLSPRTTYKSYGYGRGAKKIMWLGVIVFSLMIVILWGWAFKLRLSLVNFTESPEGALIKKTKTDWDRAFAENKKEVEQKETAKQEIKTILNQIVSNAATTATTTVANSSTLPAVQP